VLIKISVFVPPSLWCIALQLSKLMQADDTFVDAFIGMIAVFSQLANDHRTFGGLRVRCGFLSADENSTSILSDDRSQTFRSNLIHHTKIRASVLHSLDTDGNTRGARGRDALLHVMDYAQKRAAICTEFVPILRTLLEPLKFNAFAVRLCRILGY
jgi:hypothetical protein